MNIDRIYKPLRFKIKEFENKLYGTYSVVKEYDPEDVEELEEKYKELLADKIRETRLSYDDDKSLIDAEEQTDLEDWTKKWIEIIERHTSMRWEDIINDE